MAIQNFKIKHGLNLGEHELINASGSINLPAGAVINIDNQPLDALPDQTNQTGKFLSTDGSSASWNAITQYTPPTNQGGGNFLSGDGTYKQVTVPTLVSELTNDSGYQTSSQVAATVAALVDTAPSTLNTLNELAAALSNDPNFATTTANQIGAKWTQDSAKLSQWDAAYSWGNHASAGYANQSDTEYQLTFKANVADFSNVENKSSATIRAEMTSVNVTNALGYTPLSDAIDYLELSGGNLTGNLVLGSQTFATFISGVDYSNSMVYPGQVEFYGATPALLTAIGGLTIGDTIVLDGNTVTVNYVNSSVIGFDGMIFGMQVNNIAIPTTLPANLEVKGLITQSGKPVLHSGNVGDYALLKAGGEITGGITVNNYGAVGGNYPAIKFLGNEYSGGMSIGVEQNTDRTGGGQGLTFFDSIGGKAISFGVDGVEKMKMAPSGALNVIGSLTQAGNQVLHAGNYSNYALPLSGGTLTGQLNMTASIIPTVNAAYDLGSQTLGFRNVYTNDLHLSNEGHEEGNSVDGTKGNWTIQEGDKDLFIINNKTGKKYKFALEEIQ